MKTPEHNNKWDVKLDEPKIKVYGKMVSKREISSLKIYDFVQYDNTFYRKEVSTVENYPFSMLIIT
jgi:hypothetical protein